MTDENYYAYIPQELAERINALLDPCPVCDGPMILKENRITIYIGCSKCNIEAPFACDCREEDSEFLEMADGWNRMARTSVAAKLRTVNARLKKLVRQQHERLTWLDTHDWDALEFERQCLAKRDEYRSALEAALAEISRLRNALEVYNPKREPTVKIYQWGSPPMTKSGQFDDGEAK